MKYSLALKNIEIEAKEMDVIDEKLDRLKKILKPPFVCDMVIERDKHHRSGDVVKCRLSLEQEGKVWHSERVANTVTSSVDKVVEVLRKDLRRNADKKLSARRKETRR